VIWRLLLTGESHFWFAQLAYRIFRMGMAVLYLLFAILPN
jgi:hypothetical protein